MNVVVIEVKRCKELNEYVKEVNNRFEDPKLPINLFTNSWAKHKKVTGEDWVVLKINSLIPNVSPLILISWFIVLLFKGLTFSWWYSFPLTLTFGLVVYTDWFYYKSFRKGLLKKGYEGVVKRVKKKVWFEVFIEEWGKQR